MKSHQARFAAALRRRRKRERRQEQTGRSALCVFLLVVINTMFCDWETNPAGRVPDRAFDPNWPAFWAWAECVVVLVCGLAYVIGSAALEAWGYALRRRLIRRKLRRRAHCRAPLKIRVSPG